MLLRGALLALTMLGSLAAATAGEPLPPGVWELTEARSEGTGAIVVDLDSSYRRDCIERRILVRIVSEKGKDVVSLFRLPPESEKVWGRVVSRDGSERALEPRTDVLKREDARSMDFLVSHLEVLPPGLTADCVVELRWEEPLAVRHLMSWLRKSQPKIQNLAVPYPILKQTARFAKDFPYVWYLAAATKAEPLDKEEGFVMRNLPAVPAVPFAPAGLRRLSRLYLHQIPPCLQAPTKKGEDAFWAAAGKEYYQPMFERITSDSGYKVWLSELLWQLPATAQAAAAELALRLDSRIRNTSMPTFQEVAALDKKAAEDYLHPRDLEETVSRGRTNGAGMLFLYLRLLEDAKIPHRLLFVPNRDVQVLDRHRLDPDQWSGVLVMVEEPGKAPLIMDPAMRFAKPGLIDSAYQGMTALALHPKTWACEFLQVPILASRANVRRYDCRLEVGEEEDRYVVRGAFTGLPEYELRRRYLALEPAAQAKALREDLEAGAHDLRITRAEVQHALDPRKNLAWVIEGRREREAGRRMDVMPFLGLPAPLRAPASWPEPRIDPIVLPCLSLTVATASFKVPEGYVLLPVETLERKNAFGTVTWAQKQVEGQAGPEIQVTYKVEVATYGEGAALYPQFKEFLGWIEEAGTRKVVLERR